MKCLKCQRLEKGIFTLTPGQCRVRRCGHFGMLVVLEGCRKTPDRTGCNGFNQKALPCPHCESDNLVAPINHCFYVDCSDCGARGPVGINGRDAFEKWNKRNPS